MLSPHDADLARRDSDIPGLGLLLDPEAFATALRTVLPDAGVGAAKARYVRYKPGTNCLVAYRLQVAGVETDVYAKAYRAGTRGKLRKAQERLTLHGCLGAGGVVLSDAVTAVFAFPNDYKLDTLTCLADATSRQRLFATLLPDRPDLWEASIRGLRYKPERRYVARMITPTGQSALVKLHTEGDYPAASCAATAFSSRGLLRVARRLGHCNRHHAVVLEWLPGRPLAEAIRAARVSPTAAHTVGAALAELHMQSSQELEPLTREAEAASLLAAADAVAAVCPRLAESTWDLALRIASGLREVSYYSCPIHGDFSADQVLFTGESVAILDLDAAAQGDPVRDLGSFAAWLEREVMRGDLTAGPAAALTETLLEGYCAATGCDLPVHFGLYVAAGLLQVAPHAFRYREPDWPARTQAILERAEEIVRNGCVHP
ncbi:MAG: phosphotransferase family protein [Anaerolineae bacterium]